MCLAIIKLREGLCSQWFKATFWFTAHLWEIYLIKLTPLWSSYVLQRLPVTLNHFHLRQNFNNLYAFVLQIFAKRFLNSSKRTLLFFHILVKFSSHCLPQPTSFPSTPQLQAAEKFCLFLKCCAFSLSTFARMWWSRWMTLPLPFLAVMTSPGSPHFTLLLSFLSTLPLLYHLPCGI